MHKAISYKYFSNSICTVVEERHHSYCCLGYFSSSAHFDLVSLMAQKVWWHSGSVFVVHDRHSHARNCTGLLANTGLFLSTGDRYLFLLQRHPFPFDSSHLPLFQFSRVWRQSFVVEVSDLHSSSPLSSIFDNWVNLHLVQFQYSFELRGLTYSQVVQTFQDII